MAVWRLTVEGVPQPKGSTRSFRVGKRVVTTSDNKRLQPWGQLVALAAQGQAPSGLLEGPLALFVTFYLPRPKSKSKGTALARSPHPDTRPDLSKLIRAVEDPLIGIVFGDDSQICRVVARKAYGAPARVELVVQTFGES